MAVSDKSWDGSASRFTPEQYRRSCLIDTGEGPEDSKSRYKLPVREPDGTVNRAAVHAAAAALAGGRGGVQASSEQKASAASKLRGLYRQLDEEPPDSLASMAEDVTEVLELTLDSDAVWEFRSDRSARRLAGLVMPWGVVASDSRGMGRWRFQRGSLNWKDVSRVKLLRDHDISQPVGRAVSLEDRPDGLYGVFQVARGEEGDKVLSLAEDGILDGFSAGPLIEPDGWEMDVKERGVRAVFNGRLVETTVTAIPAYDDARVHHVAAMLRMPPSEDGSMAEKDDKNQSGGEGGSTVLTDPDAAMTKFQENLDQRFDAMTDKIGEAQNKQAESVTKIITTAFESAFQSLEGAQAGQRAEMAAARIKVGKEEPVYRFDGNVRAPSMVKDFWRANTERDYDAVERLRKFQEQQRDMVDILAKFPPSTRAQFATTTTGTAGDVIPPGYRPDLFVNELMQGRPIVAQASRGTITDATPFVVPRFVSVAGATADHVEGTNPVGATITLDQVTVSPGAISGSFELTREIVDASNPAIDAIALAAMRESYNQQAETKAYALLNLNANVGVSTNSSLAAYGTITNDVAITPLRDLLARYTFTRFAAPTGGVMSQLVTRNFANAQDGQGRPLVPSMGAQNAVGTGNAVTQAWGVDGLPFVPAWAMTEAVGDEIALILNRQDWWVWESPLLTFRFEEKQGPAKIELALFAYFATQVLRPAGIFSLRAIA